MATWSSTEMQIDGHTVKAQTPLIISASRGTDIPAFYADWFFDRLQKGYSVWTNPFNGARSYISYAQTRFIVFWSKNPHPLLSYLPWLKERQIKCYIQYTLNDYERERLERVPALSQRIDTFKRLVDQLGKGAVIWRFDPLILTDTIRVDDLLEKISRIGDQLSGYTEKLVFSYADIAIYKKVKANLDKSGIPYKEWTQPEMETFAEQLSRLNTQRHWHYTLATCGEKIDMDRYGIAHNRCIDGDLITRLASEDSELMRFMKIRIEQAPAPSLFGDNALPEGAIPLPHNRYFISAHRKDPGQRAACGCMAAKDIGEYNTCLHLCEYCYANASKELALANWRRHQSNPTCETITGR